MAGNNSIRGDQTITFTDNMSFDGTERGGAMVSNGQLWIGASTGRKVRLGNIIAGTNMSVVNGPGTITLNATSSGITTINGNTGSATGDPITLSSTNSGASVAFNAAASTVSFDVTDTNFNTYIGNGAGSPLGFKFENTGLGYQCLENTSGSYNSAFGRGALFQCTGIENTAVGLYALSDCTGQRNVAIGAFALTNAISSSENLAIGYQSLTLLSSGNGYNTAIGSYSLIFLDTGQFNTVIGYYAGSNYNGSESSNISIGSPGVVSESNVIRIGAQGSSTFEQNKCFIAGITGVTVSNPSLVYLNTSTGQLGQTNSVITAPAASSASTLAYGTAYQNTAGYDVMVVVYINITVNTTGVYKLGVGPTNTPTQQTLVTGVTTLGLLPISIYIPNNYYALLSVSGTQTSTIIGQIAMPI